MYIYAGYKLGHRAVCSLHVPLCTFLFKSVWDRSIERHFCIFFLRQTLAEEFGLTVASAHCRGRNRSLTLNDCCEVLMATMSTDR